MAFSFCSRAEVNFDFTCSKYRCPVRISASLMPCACFFTVSSGVWVSAHSTNPGALHRLGKTLHLLNAKNYLHKTERGKKEYLQKKHQNTKQVRSEIKSALLRKLRWLTWLWWVSYNYKPWSLLFLLYHLFLNEAAVTFLSVYIYI